MLGRSRKFERSVHSQRCQRNSSIGFAVLTLLASMQLVNLSSAHAASAPVDPSMFDARTPGNAAKLGALGQIFTSCNMNKFGAMMTSIIQGGKGAVPGLTIDAKCDMSDAGLTDEPDCKLLATDADFKKLLARQKKAIVGFTCQKSKIAAINAELGCLSDQASALTQQLGSLGDMYGKNLAQMGQVVAAKDAEIADRDTQSKKALEIINGNQDTGMMGLKAAKQMLDAAMSDTSVAEIKAAQKINTDARTQMTELIANRTIGLANQCFQTQTSPSFQCVRNGPPVTAAVYAACRYNQNQNLGAGGKIERDATTVVTADGKTGGLQSVLNEMTSEITVDPSIPMNDADTLKTAAAGGNVIHTPQELADKYQDRLAAYDGKGLKISTFIMNQFQGCYKKAQAKVNVERSQKTSAIGKNQTQIVANEAALSAKTYAKIEDMGKKYELAMTALTGTHWPLNTVGCQNAAPTVQASCLEKAFDNLRSISNGQDTKSLTMITLAGANPKSAFTIQCRGVDGCMASMQAVSRNLRDESNKLNTTKKDYIQKSNASVLAFTQKVANSLGPQSQQLQDRQNKLNSALASLGISSPIKIKPVTPETLVQDPPGTGLYRTPTSIKNVIGGLMNPPLLDVSGDNFADAQVSTADKTKDVDTALSKATDMLSRLPALRNDCANAAISKAEEGVDDIVDKLQNACAWSASFCSKERRDSLSDLAANLNKVLDTAEKKGLTTDSAATLASGISGVCPETPDSETAALKRDCSRGVGTPRTVDKDNYNTRLSYCLTAPQTDPKCTTAQVESLHTKVTSTDDGCKAVDEANTKPSDCNAAYNKAVGKARAITTAVGNGTSSASGVR